MKKSYQTTTTRLLRALAASALVVTTLVAGASSARAETAPVACEVLEISATSGTASMPASLKRLEKKFKRPPFSSWNNFAVLSRSTLKLRKQVPQPVAMSKGAAELLVRDVDRSTGKRARIALAVTVNDADGRRVVDTKASVDVSDFIAVGYSLPDNSGHIVAITCE